MYISQKLKTKYLLTSSLIIFLDQLTKYLIINNFADLRNKNFFFLKIEFIKNYGAAFNLLSNKTFFLSSVSILSSFFIIYYLIFNKNISNYGRYGLSFVLGGSIGNGIDRIMKGFVIDFINLNFVNFPVFNIADLSINIGFLILIFTLIKNKK